MIYTFELKQNSFKIFRINVSNIKYLARIKNEKKSCQRQ